MSFYTKTSTKKKIQKKKKKKKKKKKRKKKRNNRAARTEDDASIEVISFLTSHGRSRYDLLDHLGGCFGEKCLRGGVSFLSAAGGFVA